MKDTGAPGFRNDLQFSGPRSVQSSIRVGLRLISPERCIVSRPADELQQVLESAIDMEANASMWSHA